MAGGYVCGISYLTTARIPNRLNKKWLMTNTRVEASQRYSMSAPCQICGGHSRLSRGSGARCYGFRSVDAHYANCTRPEYAGQLTESKAGTFAHRLDGLCKCGHQHGLSLLPVPRVEPVKDSKQNEVVGRIWARTRGALGTVVETYLRTRGLELPIPPTLRFANLRHGPSGRDLPCMVAAVQLWPNVKPSAIHRTFLAPNGTCKANVSEPKLSYGPVRGAAIRLAPPEGVLIVAEGIETALSGMQETGIPAWASISSSNLPNLILPALPMAAEVIIAADKDLAGLSSAKLAAAQWTTEGRKVRIAVPPAGMDLNDLLRRVAQ